MSEIEFFKKVPKVNFLKPAGKFVIKPLKIISGLAMLGIGLIALRVLKTQEGRKEQCQKEERKGKSPEREEKEEEDKMVCRKMTWKRAMAIARRRYPHLSLKRRKKIAAAIVGVIKRK